jgi:hypothetical protein
MVGAADFENHLYLARGADNTGEPTDIDEAAELGLIPLEEALEVIKSGGIVWCGVALAG